MKKVSVDGTIYEREGHGPPVVLVHGLGLNRGMWQWLTCDLKDSFEVFTFDLFGHGDSPKPPSTPSLTLFSGQINNLLKTVRREKAAIVGFSLGGMIVRRFAQNYPHYVMALAILNSPHARTTSEREAVLERVRQVEKYGPEATIEAALERWFTPQFRAAEPAILEKIRQWISANDPNIYAKNYRVLAEADAEIREVIKTLSCPTLVMTGEDDHGNSPNMTLEMVKAIPNSRAIILPKLRHMALVEDPKLFNPPLVSFLKKALIKQERI